MKKLSKCLYKIFNGNLKGGQPLYNNKFSGPDSKNRFEKNLKKMPADWHYRTKEITYNLNSFRYRCAEEIPEKDFILFLGCSHTFGVGLAEDEVYCQTVANKIGMPYVNAGMGAAGKYLNAMNLAKMLTAGVRPALVINQWPYAGRTFAFDHNEIVTLGPWIEAPYKRFYDEWVKATKAEIQDEYYVNNTRLLLDGYKIPYVEFFIEKEDFGEDFARDGLHIGRKSHEKIAQYVLNSIPTL